MYLGQLGQIIDKKQQQQKNKTNKRTKTPNKTNRQTNKQKPQTKQTNKNPQYQLFCTSGYYNNDKQ